ncbi:MAG: 4Fe-4S binding protein [Phycisphaerae bacterium]
MSRTADNKKPPQGMTRRALLRTGLRFAAIGGLAGGATALAGVGRSRRGNTVWQIDPYKCMRCGNCQTYCVLKPSAVKCVHAFPMCGYCEICTGFLPLGNIGNNEAAENQVCPTAAIKRTWVEQQFYEYRIDESLCVGCGKCVEGCSQRGNGSLFLQIRHDRCVNCNQCAIAAACPSRAISRVSASTPYIIKTRGHKA